MLLLVQYSEIIETFFTAVSTGCLCARVRVRVHLRAYVAAGLVVVYHRNGFHRRINRLPVCVCVRARVYAAAGNVYRFFFRLRINRLPG